MFSSDTRKNGAYSVHRLNSIHVLTAGKARDNTHQVRLMHTAERVEVQWQLAAAHILMFELLQLCASVRQEREWDERENDNTNVRGNFGQ